MTEPWWVRPGLEIRGGRLAIAGRDAERLAREHGTPLYAFDLQRIGEQARALRDAAERAGLAFRLRFALKANREREVLAAIRGLGAPSSPESVGIDACTPGEVLHALELGWLPEEISCTGTNQSDRDFEVLLEAGVHINVDLFSQLERLGRMAPGRRAGLRVNPKASAVRGGKELYSGARATKFGIYPEDLDRALDIARRHRLEIVALHMHVGWAYLTGDLPGFERAVEGMATMARHAKDEGFPLEEINVGGGLGVPLREGERPLDLDAWAAILARRLGPLGVIVSAEPGEFLVIEAGVLLSEVITVEERLGTTFVGLDVGWNAFPEVFIYGDRVSHLLCRAPDAPPAGVVTFAGNINEGNDLFGSDHPFPAVQEGDVVATLTAGAYNQGQASLHTLRPLAKAVFFADRQERGGA